LPKNGGGQLFLPKNGGGQLFLPGTVVVNCFSKGQYHDSDMFVTEYFHISWMILFLFNNHCCSIF